MPSRWVRRAFRRSIFHLCRQPSVARDFKIAGLTPRRMAPWHLQSLGQQSVYALAPFSTQASPPHDYGLPQPWEAPLDRSPRPPGAVAGIAGGDFAVAHPRTPTQFLPAAVVPSSQPRVKMTLVNTQLPFFTPASGGHSRSTFPAGSLHSDR
jgi:hypothetical protein